MAGPTGSPLAVVDSPVGARTMPEMRCHGPDDQGTRAQFVVLLDVPTCRLNAIHAVGIRVAAGIRSASVNACRNPARPVRRLLTAWQSGPYTVICQADSTAGYDAGYPR